MRTRKRNKTQSTEPSGSKDGGFKKPSPPTGSGSHTEDHPDASGLGLPPRKPEDDPPISTSPGRQAASPATPDVPCRGTGVDDARVQALVQRILSQTVKQVLHQHVDQTTDTQSSKRHKTQPMTPLGSNEGGFKKCYGCHKLGHRWSQCPRVQVVCFSCHATGHRRAFCPTERGPTYQPTFAP